MKKLSIIILSTLLLISIGVFHSKESTQPTYTLSQDNKYISEDFRIIEVSFNGEIRGEKIQGTGEGIFLLVDHLSDIPDAPEELKFGDEIEVSWATEDYNNEVWDNIHSIKFIN